MQMRFYLDMKKLKRKSKFLLLFALFLTPLLAFGGDVPLDRDFLRLPDQRWIWLEKTGWHSTRIILGKGKKSFKNKIWSKTYETGRDDKRHTWAYAFFVRLKPGQFVAFDASNNPQVAISTHDIGTGVISWVILFRIKEDHLEVFAELDGFNVAADDSVFP